MKTPQNIRKMISLYHFIKNFQTRGARALKTSIPLSIVPENTHQSHCKKRIIGVNINFRVKY